MKPLTLEEVITAMEGTSDRTLSLGNVCRVATDSRTVRPGDLFVAIRGDRFDGHDYIRDAFAAGAAAAVVRSDFELGLPFLLPDRQEGTVPDAVLIRVDDPITAMGRLAQYYRRSVVGGAVTVVAVTGSNGKTTTKEMIAHVLAGRWQGRAAIKSYNNEIGVPLTLLSVERDDTFVVCEVGMNAPGEIATLAKLVEPDIAVITTVSEAHLEGLGSIARIAEEKLSILRHMQPDGCGIVNADCEILRELLLRDYDLKQTRSVTFGRWPEADLRLTDVRTLNIGKDGGSTQTFTPAAIEFKVNDRFVYRLNVPGRHNVFNALAAISVARRFGMDHDEIADRLVSFKLPPMRLEFERANGFMIINDGYNANPASLTSAVDVLLDAPTKKRRVLIMGDMRELGSAADRLHHEVAEGIGASAVDVVIAVGDHAKSVTRTIKQVSGNRIETHAYATTELAKRRVVSHLCEGDTILAKGSRAMGLERLVETIRQRAKPACTKKMSPKKLTAKKAIAKSKKPRAVAP